MKVNEIFESIQGEGRYAGTPALFIRLSGCNRNCPWCDTKYHTKGKEMSVKEVVSVIKESFSHGKDKIIVWTGGEPTLQLEEIHKVIKETFSLDHHLETNATIINGFLADFEYISFSPKTLDDCIRFSNIRNGHYFYYDNRKGNKVVEVFLPKFDVKIVTDLKDVGTEMLDFATMLMPLSTGNPRKDKAIQRRVWKFCIEYGLKYSPRLQVDVWGIKKRKI